MPHRPVHRMLAAGSALFFAVAAHAQDKRSVPADTIPFAVQGFKYAQLKRPGTDSITHMNECEESSCLPGSKVSYILSGPEPHSFEAYIVARTKVEAAVRAQLPTGSALRFEAPTVVRLGPVTIYESRRHQTLPDGSAKITISQSLHSNQVQIDVISSSDTLKAADGNAATFRAMMVIWMAVQGDKR